MNDNIDFSNSNKETELKCSLCKEPLRTEKDEEIIQKVIDGSKYFFHAQKCFSRYKRLEDFYGKNIKNFIGNTQFFVFDTFLDKAIPTSDEIQEIKKNNNKSSKPILKVIKNPEETIRTAINLVQSAEDEVLLLFSSANGFYRRMILGDGFLTLQRLQDTTKGNIIVRILTPFDKKIVDAVNRLKAKGVHIRYLPEALYLTVTFLIVDRKFSMTAELVNDYTESPAESLGLSTFSNSKVTVLYYISMFENLWKQSDLYEKTENLYEKLKKTNETQIQFIKETAHEIRNPIQSILGLAQVMLSNKNLDPGHIEDLLRIIIKNAKKIKFLTDNILDAARIDSQLLTLNMEKFDLVESVKDLLKDLNNQIQNKKISLILKCNEEYSLDPLYFSIKRDSDLKLEFSILLVADKLRLNQVFLNLINNAINVAQEGEIIVFLERQDNNNTVLVRITDDGPGIPSNIKDKIFTKFVTGSKSGTGLGLYICKNIIEKHGGKIWAENNKNKGANFNFTIPMTSQSSKQ
ncbi:MAG TPA: HAMP domain-containing sensor histidine kinase [Nitrososphaeraceae archaeon]|nr:HAMP domain-containing sensor histidine kinase [Nitrososphaeraceae archaeon]